MHVSGPCCVCPVVFALLCMHVSGPCCVSVDVSVYSRARACVRVWARARVCVYVCVCVCVCVCTRALMLRFCAKVRPRHTSDHYEQLATLARYLTGRVTRLQLSIIVYYVL